MQDKSSAPSDGMKWSGGLPDSRSGRRPLRGRARLLLVLVAALAMLATACGTSDDSAEESEAGSDAAQPAADTDDGGFSGNEDADTETEAGEAMEEDAMEDEAADDDAEFAESEPAAPAEGDDGSASLGAGGAQVAPTAADLGRKLIFTAFVEVGVDDVAASAVEATTIIKDLGGFVFGQNSTGGPQARTELTFKILPDDFDRALEQLGTVGELRNQTVTTDDVTERIVDLESRIGVAELGVERLRSALEGAATLEDYAEIERLLLDRESELEVMRGQLRTLEDRVDLATITLVLTQDLVENGILVDVSAYREHDGGISCPGSGINSVEVDSPITMCFDIINVGDQTLTNIALTDTVLGINAESELIEVFGTLDELAPGQAALVAWEFEPERSLRLRTRVVAIPTDGVSDEQAAPAVDAEAEYNISTFEPETDPGFGDGFSAAVAILKGLWVAVWVTLGFLLPLLILVPFIWLAWRGLRAWRRSRPKKQKPVYGPGPGGPGPTPPPPGPHPGAGGMPSGPATGPGDAGPGNSGPDHPVGSGTP